MGDGEKWKAKETKRSRCIQIAKVRSREEDDWSHEHDRGSDDIDGGIDEVDRRPSSKPSDQLNPASQVGTAQMRVATQLRFSCMRVKPPPLKPPDCENARTVAAEKRAKKEAKDETPLSYCVRKARPPPQPLDRRVSAAKGAMTGVLSPGVNRYKTRQKETTAPSSSVRSFTKVRKEEEERLASGLASEVLGLFFGQTGQAHMWDSNEEQSDGQFVDQAQQRASMRVFICRGKETGLRLYSSLTGQVQLGEVALTYVAGKNIKIGPQTHASVETNIRWFCFGTLLLPEKNLQFPNLGKGILLVLECLRSINDSLGFGFPQATEPVLGRCTNEEEFIARSLDLHHGLVVDGLGTGRESLVSRCFLRDLLLHYHMNQESSARGEILRIARTMQKGRYVIDLLLEQLNGGNKTRSEKTVLDNCIIQ